MHQPTRAMTRRVAHSFTLMSLYQHGFTVETSENGRHGRLVLATHPTHGSAVIHFKGTTTRGETEVTGLTPKQTTTLDAKAAELDRAPWVSFSIISSGYDRALVLTMPASLIRNLSRPGSAFTTTKNGNRLMIDHSQLASFEKEKLTTQFLSSLVTVEAIASRDLLLEPR